MLFSRFWQSSTCWEETFTTTELTGSLHLPDLFSILFFPPSSINLRSWESSWRSAPMFCAPTSTHAITAPSPQDQLKKIIKQNHQEAAYISLMMTQGQQPKPRQSQHKPTCTEIAPNPSILAIVCSQLGFFLLWLKSTAQFFLPAGNAEYSNCINPQE